MAQNLKRKIVAIVIVLLGIVIGAAISYAPIVRATTLRTVQTPTVHLYTGQTSGATTMRVTPYPKDLNGVKLTYSDFGDTPSLTVDPKISGVEEIETFTGITDNGDGTATLTGITRNLNSKYPYTTGGTGRTHGAGATVVFGNNPQLYARLAAPENVNTFTAIQTFASTTMPRYDVSPSNAQWTSAVGSEFVNLDKLNATAIIGAANASETQAGVGEVANRTEMASSTRIGSSGAILFLPAYNATSTFTTATSSVAVTRSDGKLSPNAIATSSTDAYSFGGSMAFTGTTTFSRAVYNGVVTLTANAGATTTVDLSLGNTFSIYLTGTQSLVFINVPTVAQAFKILAYQDGTGSRLLTNIGNTSTTTVKFNGGFAPTLTTTAGKMDTLSFFMGTSTSIIYGAMTPNF